jgi:hypothetical protein
MDQTTEQRLTFKRRFTEFLDDDVRFTRACLSAAMPRLTPWCSCAPQHGQGDYVGRIKEMMARKQTRLLVDANDLRTFDAELARKCVFARGRCRGMRCKALQGRGGGKAPAAR